MTMRRAILAALEDLDASSATHAAASLPCSPFCLPACPRVCLWMVQRSFLSKCETLKEFIDTVRKRTTMMPPETPPWP